MTDYRELIRQLVGGGVNFIIVGGAAAIAHGGTQLTEDLDIVYQRNHPNIVAIVRTLAPFQPYPRDVPDGLPFKWDTQTVWNGLNFTLSTTLGPLDLLGEIILGGKYEDLLPHTISMDIFDSRCLCLGLERLIQVKRAAGRPKDLQAIAELQALLEEQSR
jgi:predicted nucleotidyltransferase